MKIREKVESQLGVQQFEGVVEEEVPEKNRKQAFKMGISLIVITLVIVTFREPLTNAIAQLRYIKLYQIIIICLLSIICQVFEGLNFATMARVNHYKLSRGSGIVCAFYSAFIKIITFGSGSGAGTLYYLNKKNIKVSDGTAITLLAYMFHKLVIALLAAFFLIINYHQYKIDYQQDFSAFLTGIVFAIIISLLFLAICINKSVHNLLITIIVKLNKENRFQNLINSMKQFFENLEKTSATSLDNRKGIFLVILRDIIKLLCIYVIPFVILSPYITNNLWQIVAVTSVACAVASVLPSLAGIGPTEVSFLVLFAGIATEDRILSCALVYRFVTYFMPGLIGGMVVGATKIYRILSDKL